MAFHFRSGVSTFANQDNLPSLPVPSLEQTLEKYLRSVRPLVTDDEYETTKALVDDFGKEGGEGQRLQALLEARGEEHRNWLEDWWLSVAYHAWPTPLVPSSSYYIGFDPELGFPPGITPEKQGARLLTSARIFYERLLREELPPEYLGGKKKEQQMPLCMNQFRYVLGTTRIPGETMDSLRVEVAQPLFATVISNRRYYKVYVDCPSAQVEQALAAVIEDSHRDPDDDAPAVGVFTGGERPAWAAVREELIEHSEVNKATLDAIETSLVVLSFDPAEPVGDTGVARAVLSGDATHRWYDKVIQFIVFANGAVGVSGEHSPLDAMAAVELVKFTWFRLEGLSIIDLDPADPPPADFPPYEPPERLAWVPTPHLADQIAESLDDYNARVDTLDIEVLYWLEYGAEFIKRTRSSPDTFIQMIIQLAYYRLHGRPASTYETAMTRLFYHGRTETVRTVSSETVAFCEAMLNPEATRDEKVNAFRAAAAHHFEWMKECTFGQGIDRHLLAFRILSWEGGNGDPPLFADKAYVESTKWTIATSNVTSPPYFPTMGGFGPTVEDGYGICYAQSAIGVGLSISSFSTCEETSSSAMKAAIHDSFQDMTGLFPEVPSKL